MYRPRQAPVGLQRLLIRHVFLIHLLKGLPSLTNNRKKKTEMHREYQACRTDMEVDTDPILQASPKFTIPTLMPVHRSLRISSRVAVGALPTPCRYIATGSRCFQTGRWTCRHGPGQPLCPGLPCRVQCKRGRAPVERTCCFGLHKFSLRCIFPAKLSFCNIEQSTPSHRNCLGSAPTAHTPKELKSVQKLKCVCCLLLSFAARTVRAESKICVKQGDLAPTHNQVHMSMT